MLINSSKHTALTQISQATFHHSPFASSQDKNVQSECAYGISHPIPTVHVEEVHEIQRLHKGCSEFARYFACKTKKALVYYD